MSEKLLFSACFVLTLTLGSGVALGGIDYADPIGGWAYIYTGDGARAEDAAALDGTWDHDNGSDSWDGSAPGEIGTAGTGSAPGGAGVFTEGGTTFLRIQDCGDPRDAGGDWSDPSNRKMTFAHDLGLDAGVDGSAILDNGVTISFRARIPTIDAAGVLDPHYPNGGGGPLPWTTRGYNIHDSGYGVFGIKQGTGGDGVVCFSLCTPDDEGISEVGLVVNKLNGDSPTGDVDSYDGSGTEVLLTGFDPTQWHEFWIQIIADTSGGGTHKVSIWMDGNAGAPDNAFHVTAGNKDEYDFNGYLVMSFGRTDIEGAQDVDFFAYKPGLIPPAPSNPNKARAVSPAPGATVDLPGASPLGWIAGEGAVQHDVYFGTDSDSVNDADNTDTTGIYRGRQNLVIYTPTETLELGQTYYWRIDEVTADETIYQGDIWSFMIIDHVLVDDFEDYNDYPPHEIYSTWLDGYEVETNGALVGHDADFALGEHIIETTIVHGGTQSMPFYYNNDAVARYSEATLPLDSPTDWTTQGVKALSLWFRGHPAFMGGFVEGPAGTYTMTAEGADIWGNSDEFHFAFKELSGAGSIIAKVESVEDTDEWAKAGVMIRDTLEPDSKHVMMAVTPGNGVWYGRRAATGDSSTSDSEAGVTAPYWVKIERTVGGLVRAYYSPDGSTWTQIGTPEPVPMDMPMYIGLALTSHNPGVACEAVFSNVSFPNTSVGQQWTSRDVGMLSNEVEPMYVTVEDSGGAAAKVYHEDPNAALINIWTEWNIDLKDFSGQGANLNNIKKFSIGFGDTENPQPGIGLVFFDDIRLYPPRYVPGKQTPLAADFNDDGIVDLQDLQVMTGDWLQGDYTIYAAEPQPPVALWAFDNSADDSAGGNHGIIHGSPGYVAGKFEQAISLDGDDYVDCGNPEILNFVTGDWTVCAWIKTTQSGTDDANKGTVFANGGDQTGGIRYTLALNETQSGNITLTTDDDSTKAQATSSILVNDDAWHHVVGIRSGTGLQVYVDGVLDGTNNVPVGYDLSGTSQHDAYIGAITDHTNDSLIKYFVGLIDDVRIYDYALSQAEIMSVMGQSELYVPVTSPANISDDEPVNSRMVNLRDFAVLADEWLAEPLWPN